MRTYFKSRSTTQSGGIRIGERNNANFDYVTGWYVTRVPGRLIWGMHNYPAWIHKVGEGYNFNVTSLSGEWYDFIPDYQVPKGRSYFERVGDCRPEKFLSSLNRHNSVFVLKLWDADTKVDYVDLIVAPKPDKEP